MKRIFNGTVLMGYDKFYAVDLNPINYHVRLLSTPIDINNYRTRFKVLAGTTNDLTPCFITEVTPHGNIICFELPPNLIEEDCLIEEVPLADFPLWIGSKYLSYEFETLLKGTPNE